MGDVVEGRVVWWRGGGVQWWVGSGVVEGRAVCGGVVERRGEWCSVVWWWGGGSGVARRG